MSAPAETLPHFFLLTLTADELKLVHALVAIQNMPFALEMGRRKGVDCESMLKTACYFMYIGASMDLGTEGINTLFEKTQKLVAPVVFG